VSVAFPTTAFVGSIRIVYVPFTGRVFASTNFPLVPNVEGATRFVPSGFWIETAALDIVTPEIFRLMVWPAVPENVALAFSPEVVVVTVTGGPPTTIVYEEALAVRSVATTAARMRPRAVARTNERLNSPLITLLP
jgi:hypothetical protein